MLSFAVRIPASHNHNARTSISSGSRVRDRKSNPSSLIHRHVTTCCAANSNEGNQSRNQALQQAPKSSQREPEIVDVTQSIIELHEKVVCALNPIHRERRSLREAKEELNNLREDLRLAHEQVHLSESRLEHTLSRLQDLEEMMRKSVSTSDMQMLDQEEEVKPASRMEAILRDAPTSGSKQAAPAVVERGRKGGNLRNFWYPVEFSPSLTSDKLIPFEIFEDPWVLFRGPDGTPGCVRDECAHRACPLSLGKNIDGRIQCAYHGWQFSVNGKCVKTPSTTACNARIESLPCVERHGMIFVWTGEGPPPLDDDNFTCLVPPEGYQVHSEILLEVPVEHGLLMENLLDLAHAPFTHTSTFAKGWSIPNMVNFKSSKEASVNGEFPGHWDPYPIDMAFQPPCMVLSTIGIARPGAIQRGTRASDCEKHLHQLHVCLPAGSGRTRLLYRMSLDFAGFARYLPFIDRFWKSLANQVLGEDLVLVKGQQDRMKQGADVWANPVPYDKLGVRYRRWRNQVEKGKANLSADYTL